MKIVLFHPRLLPPRDYGGVERVVLWLAKGLKELGHEVWVAAQPGSLLPEGVSFLDPSEEAGNEWFFRLPKGVEIVHFMAPPGGRIWDEVPCAKILTVHGNGKPGESYPRDSVFLSQDHARRHGARAFVYNGIDPVEYQFHETRSKEDWFLFLSKTSWGVKNVAGAIRLCAQAQASLRIAGGNRPLLSRLEASLRPRMRWIGPVAGIQKAELLARARALLFPILWEEPFGLVVVESLISGTPVLAAKRGSLPELVTPDVGALLDSDEDWIECLAQSRFSWSAEACRKRALEHFHYLKMSATYVELYRQITSGGSLHVREPGTLATGGMTRS